MERELQKWKVNYKSGKRTAKVKSEQKNRKLDTDVINESRIRNII